MASFSVVHNNGFMATHGFHPIRAKSFDRNGVLCSFSYGPTSFPSLGCQICRSKRHGVMHNCKIGSWINRSGENKHAHLDRRDDTNVRKKFSLRLRPRLRLLSIRLKKVLVRATLNDLGMFLRKNMKSLVLTISISVALGICYLFLKLTAIPSPKHIPYSDLVMNLQSGSVTKVLFEEGSRLLYFNMKDQDVEAPQMVEENLPSENAPNVNVADGIERKDVDTAKIKGFQFFGGSLKNRASTPQWQYSTRKIDHDENFLLSLMREKGTTYSSAPQSMLRSIRNILITVLTLWIPLAPLMWLVYRQLSAGNSPARKRKPSRQMVSFDDVEGVDSAKVELMEIVLCLQGSINYNKLGARLPRGVLLVGPPGTGKTLLARAVAGEAGVPFFSVSASEFVEMFVGRGASRIRDLFNVARKSAPSIVFIDELDAVGGKRGRSFNDERDQTLNQLLTEMDGFDSDTKVIVIAATNRPEALDPALCRPGRFSRKVQVGEPDEVGRRKILGVHLREVPLEEDKQLICNLVASLTPGFVGADLANVVNEAALLAARRGGESVSREDVMEAIERAKFGIDGRRINTNTISKELAKLFPWMPLPYLTGRSDTRPEGLQGGPLGYQTLS
ncbi:hypothetical protein Dimus_033933 [Dionaea muscipula]